MEDGVLSTEKDDNEPSLIPQQQPIHHKPKRKFVAYASLCLISAVIGGLTTVSAIPYIYRANVSSIQAENTSSLKQVAYTGNATQLPVVQIAKNVGPAVVGVSNFKASRSSSGNSGLQEAGSGSGFIIDAKKGFIATNNHVIEGAQKITINLSDGRNIDAKVIGADPLTDLAVLQIADTKNLTAVNLGDSSKVQVGESVVAIGNPGGDEFARSVTTGVISATNRTLALQGEASFNLIQTDATINPGNSGGPLVNYQGQVIGITSVKYVEKGFEGMGFAIPISDALPTLQQLMTSGVAKHPALLVNTDDQYLTYAKSNNKPLGAYIAGVSQNGPAAKVGIVKGDVITKINNAQVHNSSDLIRELYKNNVGDKVAITYIRDGVTKQVEATLGEIASNQ